MEASECSSSGTGFSTGGGLEAVAWTATADGPDVALKLTGRCKAVAPIVSIKPPNMKVDFRAIDMMLHSID